MKSTGINLADYLGNMLINLQEHFWLRPAGHFRNLAMACMGNQEGKGIT
jgi:hypothetical protein